MYEINVSPEEFSLFLCNQQNFLMRLCLPGFTLIKPGTEVFLYETPEDEYSHFYSRWLKVSIEGVYTSPEFIVFGFSVIHYYQPGSVVHDENPF